MKYSEQAKQKMMIWSIISWTGFIAASVMFIFAVFAFGNDFCWGVTASLGTLAFLLAGMKTSVESNLQNINMMAWKMLESGGGTEETKNLYKTLQFGLSVQEHETKNLEWVSSQVEKTRTEIESKF